jgi:phosphatidate cytidylyltransferase
VAGADPANPLRAFGPRGSELAIRVCSALVLVPLAIWTAYVGGWLFAVFWGVAAMGVLWEWITLVAGADRRSVLMAGAVALALALVLAGTGQILVSGILASDVSVSNVLASHVLAAVIVLAMGMLGVAALAPAERRTWIAGGIPYAGALGIAPIVLRSDAGDGFLAVIFLFAIVWATDIVAYFVGRTIGGPKLMPNVSPKKTWSGALGGTLAAIIVAVALGKTVGLTGLFAVAMLAVVLSVFAQAGDLFESLLKRRFGAKDSSHLIPGHGGLMDRLDGFVSAGVVAALIGVARGGFEAPGRGLLVW